jgi:hypothetical protein
MPEIKKTRHLSEWVEYLLDTTMVEPPVLKVRLKMMDAYDMVDTVEAGAEGKMGRYVLTNALEAVQEWDLTENGEPIPCTTENKWGYLRDLMGEPVVGREGLLGRAIYEDCQKKGLFLKN